MLMALRGMPHSRGMCRASHLASAWSWQWMRMQPPVDSSRPAVSQMARHFFQRTAVRPVAGRRSPVMPRRLCGGWPLYRLTALTLR
jgi:hypothetical protein